ncbi:ABC transporter family substrate-binding protein, partial [Arthrobacter sp. HMSC08H08]
MRLKRISMAVAATAAASLALTACSPGGSQDKKKDDKGGDSQTVGDAKQFEGSGRFELSDVETQNKEIKITVGSVEYGGYNGLTPDTYSTYTSAVAGTYMPGFWYYGTDGKIYQNKDMGSYKLISEDPMKVEYTIHEDAVWSDGTPITVADAISAWGTQTTLSSPDAEKDDDGNAAPLFNNVSNDLVDMVPDGPQGDPKGKKFTVTFKEPNPDWELQTWLSFPAHVIAKNGDLSTEEYIKALQDQDGKKLEKAAEFWNKGWNRGAGKLPKEEDNVSGGPYILDSWQQGESVTVKANPKYWGEKPGVEKLTFRFIDDSAMVQGLKNKDVQVIAPQTTPDIADQLKGLEGSNEAKLYSGNQLTWEHLDFNFRKGNVMEDLDIRKAFAMCVPRQEIVDKLVKPINPDATVLNAREIFSDDENYEGVISESYNGEYDDVDVEGAKKLLKDKGKEGATVRIGYAAPNPRRSQQVQLIKNSCEKAGFKIEDVSAKDFFDPGGTLDTGKYEVALFAWAGSGQKTSGWNIYHSKGAQNYGKFKNADVDAAFDKMKKATADDAHLEAVKEAEKALWDNLYGIPIFQHPGMRAADPKI